MNTRREFLMRGTGAAMAACGFSTSLVPAFGQSNRSVGGAMETVRLLGVPLRSGSLYPGSENDAKGYRDTGIIEIFRRAGIEAADDGDLAIPSYLPHHSIPPIRSWPGPRIVWDLIEKRIDEYVKSPNSLPVLLGCDCSIVVGTAHALAKSGDVHVIYIDGDFDDAPPDTGVTRSAASLAVWLLTNDSPFYPRAVAPEKVTVVGWSNGPFAGSSKVRSVSLSSLRQRGAGEAVKSVLRDIPQNAPILVHFDIDSVRQRDLPAVYFPHQEGMTLQEAGEVMDGLLSDRRVRLVEVTEYAVLRDIDGQSAKTIAELLAHGLARRT